jgi:WG containing repeat
MAGRFSEGLAAVANNKDQWGYIDVKGKLVIGYAYNFADTFNEGIARVMKGGAMKNIDRAGKEVKE